MQHARSASASCVSDAQCARSVRGLPRLRWSALPSASIVPQADRIRLRCQSPVDVVVVRLSASTPVTVAAL
eukprot:14926438-Alexandrium_andersonii.AAC.1